MDIRWDRWVEKCRLEDAAFKERAGLIAAVLGLAAVIGTIAVWIMSAL